MRILLVVLAIWTTSVPAAARDKDALTAATRALCGKRVALLGENGEHGSGATLAFKAALVQRLVERCGYDAILFEAGRYEFVAFQRAAASGTADRAMLNAAVGGLWARYAEFRPLADFLVARANRGQIHLAGIDDQLGSRGATYTNGPMIDELTGLLSAEWAAPCATALRARIFSSESYGVAERARLLECIAAMRAAPGARDDVVSLLTALDRTLRRDLAAPPERYAGREQSMFAAFQEVAARRPVGTKYIVWGATAHLARDSSSWPPLPHRPSVGALIHHRYGGSAFTLGFSALGGGWRRTPGRPETPWSVAPPGSVEEAALRDGAETAYLDRRALRRLGAAPARMWNEPFVTTRWNRAIDGLIVFRTDYGLTPTG